MGHSTVSFAVRKQLSSTEVKVAFKKTQGEHRDEYGYNQSPDSLAGAELPTSKHSYQIYSEQELYNIMNKVESYESFYAYYIPQKTWDDNFKKNSKKVEKAVLKLKETKNKLEILTSEFWVKSKMNEAVDQKVDTHKSIFYTCSNCDSKINMGLFLRYNRSAPHQCPTCGDKANGQFLSLWRTKLFGKSYVARRTKIELEITKYQEALTQLQNEDLKSINFDQLPKKLKDQVCTMMWADVHH